MNSTTRAFRTGGFIIATLAVAAVLAACGSTTAESTSDATPTTTAAPTTTTTTVAPTTQPAPVPIVVTATDYGYTGLPDRVPSGTAVSLVNDVELHELVAIRLPDDEQRSAAELLQLPPEEVAGFFPFMQTVIITPPAQEGFPVEGTGVLTEPGRYLVLCAIPTGAIPEEYLAAAAEAEGGPPQVDGGPPHFVNGMFAELTVEG